MICKNCGNGSIIDGSKFCNNCGAKLKAEDSDEVTYYDPYQEEILKREEKPTCGWISLGLYLGASVLQIIMISKSGGNLASTLALSMALTPIIVLLLIGALTLAIVSLVRKERKTSAEITIGLIIAGLILYIIDIVTSI